MCVDCCVGPPSPPAWHIYSVWQERYFRKHTVRHFFAAGRGRHRKGYNMRTDSLERTGRNQKGICLLFENISGHVAMFVYVFVNTGWVALVRVLLDMSQRGSRVPRTINSCSCSSIGESRLAVRQEQASCSILSQSTTGGLGRRRPSLRVREMAGHCLVFSTGQSTDR